jgi:hypothetical protein
MFHHRDLLNFEIITMLAAVSRRARAAMPPSNIAALVLVQGLHCLHLLLLALLQCHPHMQSSIILLRAKAITARSC